MPQLFKPGANQIVRLTLGLGFFGLGSLAALVYFLDRSPYRTRQGDYVTQQVPFSHDHHIEALGIDCRYCHTAVEESASAGIPPTATCMNCHKQIWADTEMLRPVRDSYTSGQPLVWNKVNDLPDFAYFNHSIHVAKGIGCVTCHGPVNEMPLIYQAHSLQMRWCLECHRAPEKFVRPREEVFNMTWEPEGSQVELGRRLVEEYDIQSLENCSTCHR